MFYPAMLLKPLHDTIAIAILQGQQLTLEGF